MVDVNPELAAELAEVARLLESDDEQSVLHRVVALAVRVVPGADAAVMLLRGERGTQTVAVSDPLLLGLHEASEAGALGPADEALRLVEPRQLRDVEQELRWPEFRKRMRELGLANCLALPVNPDAVLVLYGRVAEALDSASYDLATLFAAQGATALHNLELYQASQQMVSNLRAALKSRAVIEQAKGIVMRRCGCTDDAAFALLRVESRKSNTRLRDVAAEVVNGQRNVSTDGTWFVSGEPDGAAP